MLIISYTAAQLAKLTEPNQTSLEATGKLIVHAVVVPPHTINYLFCGVPNPFVPSSTKYVRCPPLLNKILNLNIEPNIETQYWNPILNQILNSHIEPQY